MQSFGKFVIMNIFTLCGDMSHILSKILLLLQIVRSRNARGISVKTQELYLAVFVLRVVFALRHLDLFKSFNLWYNSIVTVFYITITSFTIWKIEYSEPIRSLYNPEQDSFPHWKCAFFPSLLLGLILPLSLNGFAYASLSERLVTTSIYLESVAILPQLLVLQRYRLVENLTGKFILFLGSYKALYILDWIYRAHTEPDRIHNWGAYACGVLQTLLYVDFFYQYIRTRQYFRSRVEDLNMEENDGLIFEDTMELQQREVRAIMECKGGTTPLMANETPDSWPVDYGVEKRTSVVSDGNCDE